MNKTDNTNQNTKSLAPCFVAPAAVASVCWKNLPQSLQQSCVPASHTCPIYIDVVNERLVLVDIEKKLVFQQTMPQPKLVQRQLKSYPLLATILQHVRTRTRIITDCTAGFERDSWLLACAGYTVHAFDHNPICAILLTDALNNAPQQVRARIHFRCEDWQTSKADIDVVYIDPMFSHHGKAQVQKYTQMLRIVNAGETPASLAQQLNSAKQRGNHICVKIPAKPQQHLLDFTHDTSKHQSIGFAWWRSKQTLRNL